MFGPGSDLTVDRFASTGGVNRKAKKEGTEGYEQNVRDVPCHFGQ